MTQSAESPPVETNGSPIPHEREENTLRPISPSSGGSDNDGGERPVREKFKKASIAGLSERAAAEENPIAEKTDTEPPLIDTGKAEDKATQADAAASRGRPTRKRSFDDLQNDSPATPDGKASENATNRGNHKRMRSRDISGKSDHSDGKTAKELVEAVAEEEDDELARLSPGGAGVMVEAPSEEDGSSTEDKSPKKKRSRDQFDKDQSPVESGSGEDNEKDDVIKEDKPTNDELTMAPSAQANTKGEPEKKRPRDEIPELSKGEDKEETQATDAKPAGTDATTTPFGTLPQPKSPAPKPDMSTDKLPQTSSSAFASSGLAAFATKSAFGALNRSGTSTGFGSFGAKSSTGGFGSAPGFGGTTSFGASGTTGFGGLGATSGFGGLGGSTFGGSSLGLSSFATPGGVKSKPLGSLSPTKAPGKSDDDGDEDSEAGGILDAEDDKDPKDSRFYAQQMETGEEGEETLFHCRAKLFYFEKEWKERGVGTLKLNRQFIPSKDDDTNDGADSDGDDDDTPPSTDSKARLIMRTDGAHRVVLNTPILKGMKFGTPDGGEPSGKQMNFTGIEDGKPGLFLIRIGREEIVKGLYRQILMIQDGLL